LKIIMSVENSSSSSREQSEVFTILEKLLNELLLEKENCKDVVTLSEAKD